MVFWLFCAICLGFSQCLLWFKLVFLSPISIYNLVFTGMVKFFLRFCFIQQNFACISFFSTWQMLKISFLPVKQKSVQPCVCVKIHNTPALDKVLFCFNFRPWMLDRSRQSGLSWLQICQLLYRSIKMVRWFKVCACNLVNKKSYFSKQFCTKRWAPFRGVLKRSKNFHLSAVRRPTIRLSNRPTKKKLPLTLPLSDRPTVRPKKTSPDFFF